MKTGETENAEKGKKLSSHIAKYFWQASALSGSRKKSVHRFFRKIPEFDDFSDIELYTFSKYLHVREFEANEVVFHRNQAGLSFYLIYEGSVGITLEEKHQVLNPESDLKLIAELEKYNYFGELSLLEEQNRRNAAAISLRKATLLAIYKPDLDEMIEEHSVVAAKFLKALSYIVAKRLQLVANELKIVKDKLREKE